MFFPSLSDQGVVLGKDPFKGNGHQVSFLVTNFVEMLAHRMLQLLPSDVATVFRKSFTETSAGFPNVNPRGALFTCQFVNYILGLAVDGGRYLPLFARPVTFVGSNPASLGDTRVDARLVINTSSVFFKKKSPQEGTFVSKSFVG